MCGADRSCVIVACVVAVAYKTVSVCRLPNERSRATFRKSVARRQPPIFHRNDSRPPTNDTSLHAAAGAARTRMERSKDDLARLVGSLLAPPELRHACATQMPVFANGSSVGDWSVCCAALRRSSSAGLSPDPCLVASIGIGGQWLLEDALAYAGCTVHAFDPTIKLRASHEAHASAMRSAGFRTHFHFEGLSGHSSDTLQGSRSGSKSTGGHRRLQADRSAYGAIDPERLVPLDTLLGRMAPARARQRIDVLKIDCEG
jgi:hypothetical protein